jgi:hypothetical protein
METAERTTFAKQTSKHMYVYNLSIDFMFYFNLPILYASCVFCLVLFVVNGGGAFDNMTNNMQL